MFSFSRFISIILFQIIFIGLVIFGVLPQFSLIVLAAVLGVLFLILDWPLSVALFVASIPLFTVLPLAGFPDSFAAWRILILIIFLRWIYRDVYMSGGTNKKNLFTGYLQLLLFKKFSFLIPLFILILLLAASVSIATYPLIGVKKIIFILNALMIIPPVLSAVRQIGGFLPVGLGVVAAALIAAGIGIIQMFITAFWLPLNHFWQWWAGNFIPVFYGQNLADLLSMSNTWFSYYADSPPTLRAFSVFPDSHSFALFLILILPVLVFYAYRQLISRWNFWPVVLVLISLFGVIFSGSRGTWVSAGMVLVFMAGFILAAYLKDNFKKIFLVPALILAIFFLLFPAASLLTATTQETFQGGGGAALTFERFKTASQTQEISNLGRMEIWESTIISIAKHPWLGVGLGNYALVLKEDISAVKRGASAHNLYLDLAAESGIPAMLALVVLFLSIILAVWRKIKENIFSDEALFYVVFAMSFLWMAAYGLFDVVLLNDKVLLMFLAVTAMVMGYTNKSEARNMKSQINSKIQRQIMND